MFEAALRFPWHGEAKLETLVIGGFLTLLGVIFVPLLFVYGYLVRVVRRTADGDTESPPPFDEWGELFVDGLVAFVISTVYVLIPTVVVVLGTLLFVLPVSVVEGGVSGSSSGLVAVIGVVLGLVVVVLALVLGLATVYLIPAAVAAFALRGQFRAAFSPSALRPVVTDRRYATGWVVAVAVSLLVQVVASVVAATGIGALLVPFVLFYGYVAGAYAIGVGVSEVAFATRTDDDSATSQPAV